MKWRGKQTKGYVIVFLTIVRILHPSWGARPLEFLTSSARPLSSGSCIIDLRLRPSSWDTSIDHREPSCTAGPSWNTLLPTARPAAFSLADILRDCRSCVVEFQLRLSESIYIFNYLLSLSQQSWALMGRWKYWKRNYYFRWCRKLRSDCKDWTRE